MDKFSAKERQWVAQWKRAGRELAKRHAEELQALSDEELLKVSNQVLTMNGSFRSSEARRRRTSGFVEQQKYFMKWKS